MSIPYNPSGSAPRPPSGKVDFGWISESWQWFAASAGTWIGALVIFGVINYAASMVLSLVFRPFMPIALTHPSFGQPPVPGQPPVTPDVHAIFAEMGAAYFQAIPLFMVQGLILMPLTGWGTSCLVSLGLRQVRGEQISFGMAFEGGKNWLQMTLYLLMYSVGTWIGFLGCGIGALFTGALFLPGFALVADGSTAGDAFKASFDVVKRDLLSAAGFVFVFALLYFVSILPCGLGALATIPMAVITYTLAYRDMIGWSTPGGGSPFTNQPGTWPPPPTGGYPPPSGPGPYTPGV